MTRHWNLLAALTTIVLCLAPLTYAQQIDAKDDAIPSDATPPGRWVIDASAGYQLDTDIDNGGEFSVSRFGAGVSTRQPITSTWAWTAGLSYRLASFDFSGSTGLGALSPWEDIHSVSLRGGVDYIIDRQWMVFGGLTAGFDGESGADFDDSLTVGGYGGARFQVNEVVALSFGTSISTEIEDDISFIPLLGVDWTITDTLTLTVGREDVMGMAGPGASIRWQAHDQVALAAGGLYHKQRFRLDGSGTAPNGVGQEQSIATYLQAQWTPSENTSVSLIGGVAFAGEVTVENANGVDVAQQDHDPAPFVGVLVDFRF